MGTLVIDPAVYFGHPGMDLAFIDTFQPAAQDQVGAYECK
jgi:fructosamine-3-kinase